MSSIRDHKIHTLVLLQRVLYIISYLPGVKFPCDGYCSLKYQDSRCGVIICTDGSRNDKKQIAVRRLRNVRRQYAKKERR